MVPRQVQHWLHVFWQQNSFFMHNTKYIKPAKAELPWWKGRGAAGWELRRLSMLGFQNEPRGAIWEPVPREATPSPLTFLLFYLPVLSSGTPCFTFYASKYSIAPTHPELFHASVLWLMLFLLLRMSFHWLPLAQSSEFTCDGISLRWCPWDVYIWEVTSFYWNSFCICYPY